MQSPFLIAMAFVGMNVAAAPEPVKPRWAERDVAVFRNMMFDFKAKRMLSESVNSDLQDCSSATILCFKTAVFALSLPRSCDFTNAIGKGPDGNGLVVIDKVDKPLQHLQLTPDTMFLIYNKNYPFIVYEYDPDSGIIGVSYDALAMMGAAPRADILASIKAGNYAKEKRQRWSYSSRLTFDSFGACTAG